MMNCVLIVTNFNAGRKKAINYKKKVIDFVLRYTKSFKFVDIDELREIDVAPYDTILAMGGDGTVNKVLPYLTDSGKVLGIIPCGTANLLAAKLGLSYKLYKTLRIIENNNIKLVDTLDINGNKGILRFGLGYDSDIICKTPQTLKNKFGYFAYFIAGIIFALRLKKKEYKMIIDGEPFKTKASSVIIANASNMYRNLVTLANNSQINDGIADIFILKTTNPIAFFFEFVKILFGIRKDNAFAEYKQAKNIIIENNWLVCHVDGEKRVIKENININVQRNSVKIYSKY